MNVVLSAFQSRTMSFNKFTNRSQNYGNTKASGRNQIIANSRAKRQERQRKKKREDAAQIIQKWFRACKERNDTAAKCKELFNEQITNILKSQRNKKGNHCGKGINSDREATAIQTEKQQQFRPRNNSYSDR